VSRCAARLRLVKDVTNSPNMNSTAAKFARVIIPSLLRQPLIYSIPEVLRDCVRTGTRVVIPLGRRKVIGVVSEVLESSPLQTKAILAVPDEVPVIDESLLLLAQWVARYYVASLGEVLASMLPPPMRRESIREVLLLNASVPRCDGIEAEIVRLLRQKQRPMSVKTLTRQIPSGKLQQALDRLEGLGAISVRERLPGSRRTSARRNDNASAPSTPHATAFVLTPAQQSALAAIAERQRHGGFEIFLLHGVTGSGKTEVYLHAIQEALLGGFQSLILIPEISLTPQLIDRLSARFPGRVGVLHSALTAAERWSQWKHIAQGGTDIVIGARSAVFAPLPRLGLIIVDEEHDPSYKQEEGLRYNGRDVAVVRGKQLRCPVILGSATPAIETYENCRQDRYRLLAMPERVLSRPLPTIGLIDLRVGMGTDCNAGRRHPLISQELADAVTENYAKSRQSLIFLNRRGFANFLQCRFCGHLPRCAHCSVTLTLHLERNSLCCHHCNFRRPVMETCPACAHTGLDRIGSGTEQIEVALRQLVPGARIARMDRDTMSKRGSHEALIRSWENREIDILIGTQMITKGHDVSSVTIVGALRADMSLNMPDFRAAERTFQLLSQVAGRSGRGDDPGRVLVQTFTPDHYTMRHLLHHDYAGFFANELEFRRALNYPPFRRLVSLRVEGPKAAEVESKIKTLAQSIRTWLARPDALRAQIEVLGPAPAPILRLRGRYRWQLLLKGKESGTLLELAGHARSVWSRSRHYRLHVDVDPYSML
jgi:primosomal protein N' (replication factor Y) (superfamily II helicase)